MRRRHHRRDAETQIQMAVIDHLKARGVPGLLYWHTPNEGKRKTITGLVLQRMGMLAGVSDLIFMHDGKMFALELKAPGGRPTEDQIAFIMDFNRAGGFGCIAQGLDRALYVLESWGLLRGVAA